MGCSTYLGLGWRYQPLAPGHPTFICDIGVNTSFCVLVGLLLTQLNHYLDHSINSNMFFWLFKVTQQIGDTAFLRFHSQPTHLICVW